MFGLGATEPIDDELERLVPRDALEMALSLRPDANRRIQQAVRPVDALTELADLGADVAAGDGIFLGTVDLDDASAVDGDVERAGVGTVERAGRLDDRGRRANLGSGFVNDSHNESIMP